MIRWAKDAIENQSSILEVVPLSNLTARVKLLRPPPSLRASRQGTQVDGQNLTLMAEYRPADSRCYEGQPCRWYAEPVVNDSFGAFANGQHEVQLYRLDDSGMRSELTMPFIVDVSSAGEL